MSQTQVFVTLDGEDVLAGTLFAHRRRRTESATFSYATAYLARPGAYALDPELPLAGGARQTRVGQALFGAFSDCVPTGGAARWSTGGRQLSLVQSGAHSARRARSATCWESATTSGRARCGSGSTTGPSWPTRTRGCRR